MNRRALFAVAGAVAGAALAALGLWLSPAAVEATDTTTTTTTRAATATRVGPWWVSPGETRVGPTVIVLEGVDYSGGEVVVNYQLHDVAPVALGRVLESDEINPFFALPATEAIVAPEQWVLETTSGEYPGTSETARVRTARFDVPDDFVLGTITGLRLESYRMRVPYLYEVSMPPLPGSRLELDEGFAVEIRAVLPQSDSVIFQVDYETPSDSFTAGEPIPAIIRGVGTDWVSYNQREFEGLQLIYGEGQPPDPLVLEVRSTYWVPFTTSTRIDLGGSIG